MADITVVIPTIPPRERLLARALDSVKAQILQPAHIIVERDDDHQGASRTRQRGLERVETKWVAFLDDDDELLHHHLHYLHGAAVTTGADVVYPWFGIVDGNGRDISDRDPLKINGEPAHGRVFDNKARDWLLTRGNFIPVTVLARTEVLRGVGGFPVPGSQRWPHKDCEDWGLWQDVARAGGMFVHVPVRTWLWRWNGRNTSGRGDRW